MNGRVVMRPEYTVPGDKTSYRLRYGWETDGGEERLVDWDVQQAIPWAMPEAGGVAAAPSWPRTVVDWAKVVRGVAARTGEPEIDCALRLAREVRHADQVGAPYMSPLDLADPALDPS